MLQPLKDFIKTKPRLYDFLDSLRSVRGDEMAAWIDNFSRRNRRKVKFIQVGANDGLRWDPLRKFILRDRWEGVLIEPIPAVFELLKANYAYTLNKCELRFENCAIASASDSVDFWTYSDEFLKTFLSIEDRLYYLRKSSLDRRAVERSLSTFPNLDEIIICRKVQSCPLSRIIEKHFIDHKVDLIFIDAEGRDDEVIRTLDFERCHPRAIVYESHHLGNKKEVLQAYLMSKGYSVTQFAGDAVAEIHHEH